MKPKSPLLVKLHDAIDDLRLQTAKPDALIQLSVIGLLVGLLTGGVLVLFVLLIDSLLAYWLPANDAENFEALSPTVRFILPVFGGLILATLFHRLANGHYTVGVVYVLERLRYHEGYLQIRSFYLQFLGAAIALMTGQSMGREGPAVHLGASVGSLFGQSINLPNNTIRTLIACGTAAAIGAAFNTPLAGVIFAMEVILIEYTVSSFIPIMIAAVAATGVARWAFGSESALTNIALPPVTVDELPALLLLGIAIGLTSTAFTSLIKFFSQISSNTSIYYRFIAAGLFTGAIAIFIPQVMGLGYDTVQGAIDSEISIALLGIILISKVLATSVSVGCGLPAGLISPSLVIGATCGALVCGLLIQTDFVQIQDSGLYALIGMSAMMGACLQAPLAALTAVFEITANPTVIWPSMLAIVVAQLISKQVFKQPPVFDLLLAERGLVFKEDPFTQTLSRSGVAKIMNQSIAVLPQFMDVKTAREKITHTPQWIILRDDTNTIALLRGVDLLKFLEEHQDPDQLDLLEIPGKRLQVVNIDLRATLAKARDVFQSENAEALCVVHWNPSAKRYVYGVVIREEFEKLYLS